MGAIREMSTGRTRILEVDHVIGRAPAPKCCLTLNEPYISGVHAELRWTGQAWELKDRGSRNGTFLDGRRIEPGVAYAVEAGARIGFGRLGRDWELTDDSAPVAMAIPLDGGDPVILDGDFIPLPSSDDPCATIYQTIEGSWVLESPGEPLAPLVHMQTFEAVGRLWRFCRSDMSPSTLAASGLSADLGCQARDTSLFFSVSQDEEYVHLRMTCGNRDFDMGARQHNYLLLTLGRHRLAEATEGLPEASCGWLDQEDLSHDPSMAPPSLNCHVFRIRQQFAKAGVVDAASIVERRPRPWQLRVGTARISIATL
jgi:FHA domain